MDTHERRRVILNQLRNTFEKVAKKDDTISKRKLISEIMKVFEVSSRSAEEYIKELIEMGTIKQDGDMLRHSKEKDIRLEYLSEKAISKSRT